MEVKQFGTEAVGIVITGNPKNREPESVRIRFPGGEIDVIRATDGSDCDYWIHLNVNHADVIRDRGVTGKPCRVVGARIDLVGQHASAEIERIGLLGDPNMNHLAVRVGRQR